jgi:hypothetical protein
MSQKSLQNYKNFSTYANKICSCQKYIVPPTITPTAQKIQFVSIDGGTGLSVDHETNTFCMIVGSDNQFEQKFAQITLEKMMPMHYCS